MNNTTYISDRYLGFDIVFFPIDEIENITWNYNSENPQKPVVLELTNGDKYILGDSGHNADFVKFLSVFLSECKKLDTASYR